MLVSHLELERTKFNLSVVLLSDLAAISDWSTHLIRSWLH